jgi:hypothetical protein
MWLLFGEGEMLLNDNSDAVSKLSFREQLLAKKNNKESNDLIPYYEDVATFGGTKQIGEITTQVQEPTGYIHAGDWFKGATHALKHYGDSMLEYQSGCILALRELKDKADFIWGRNYVIEYGSDFNCITKKIQIGKDDNHILACSTNQEKYDNGRLIHEPKSINLSHINRSFLVLGVVIKEQSTSGIMGVK